MNRSILLGIALAALGYLLYRFYLTPTQTYTTTSLNPNSKAGPFTTDSYQTYPFTANVAPRVDNSNQPWANNNRAAINSVSSPQVFGNMSQPEMIASYAKSAASLTNSLTSIWEDLGVSDWFSSGDSDAFMTDYSFDTDSSSDIFSGGSGDFNYSNVG